MKRKFIAWFIATLICGVLWSIGYFGYSTLRARGMEDVAGFASLLGMLGLVVIGGVWFLLLVVLMLIDLIVFARPRIMAVYRDGIANLHKGELHAWAWPDISAIYSAYFIDRSAEHDIAGRFEIVHRDGSSFVMNSFVKDFDQLMARIRHEVYSRLRPVMNQALDEGQNVPFGKDLIIEGEGIRIAETLLTWNAITEYHLSRGILYLHGPKANGQVPVSATPNFELFVEVLRRKLPDAKGGVAI